MQRRHFLGAILASLIAGALWSAYGQQATFLAGAAFSALAAGGLLIYNTLHTPRSR